MPGLQPHGGLLTTRAKGPVQGCRNTFYFGGGANFSYQNMDVARTRFTSVARKLIGGLQPPSPSWSLHLCCTLQKQP